MRVFFFLDDCWLLVVLIKGPDLCSPNTEMVSETSEIGYKDVLKLAIDACEYAYGGKWLMAAERIIHPRQKALLTKTPTGERVC
jgi:hypothetical protein